MAAPTVAPYTRAAYALGWATVDDPDTFPVGEAGHTGLAAAVAAAETLDGHPHLVELVVEAGRDAAARQALHRARLRLYNKHRKLIVAAAAGLLAAINHTELAATLLAVADQPRRIRAQQAAASLTAALTATPQVLAAWQQANDQAAQDAAARGYSEAANRPGAGKPAEPKKVTAGLPAAATAIGAISAGRQWITGQITRQAWDLSGTDLTNTDQPAQAVSDTLDALDGIGAAAEDQMHATLGDTFVRYIAASGLNLLYWQTEEDNRVCPACFANEDASPYLVGTDTIPDMPAHPNCLPGWSRVVVPGQESHRHALDTAEGVTVLGGDGRLPAAPALAVAVGDFGRANIRAVTDREYVGDLVQIELASGHKLAGTPNHPIGTPSGWVPLAELAVGDDVLRSTGSEWVATLVDPNVDHIPPTIEQVAQTFPVTFGPVPTASEDFHGDGTGSDVHVVRADCLLLDDVQSSLDEGADEHPFERGDVAEGAFNGPGLLDQIASAAPAASDSLMGGSGQTLPLLGRRVLHPHLHGITPAPRSDTVLDQDVADESAADAEGFCERLLALSADIAADQIIRISRFPVRTHVYNLDTVNGWFISNGIVTHNCRCNWA